ncbi:hypothetical protein A5638_22310 [Mycolicibacterium fortuitum]|uniref:hypothetical protein n=1 Tax=Mycolicibacterium fortuitum TaxID=1766 RepID=UPI0007ECCC3C|nr:hypothetical protein [Mycolicibacterium fortuitum]OBJ95256.1 hypothetical protein A5638_22310 [Mycolicibacterium fortuitum]
MAGIERLTIHGAESRAIELFGPFDEVLQHWSHDALETAEVGGYAFVSASKVYIIAHEGSWAIHSRDASREVHTAFPDLFNLTVSGQNGVNTFIDAWLAERIYRARPIALDDLGVCQRAAVLLLEADKHTAWHELGSQFPQPHERAYAMHLWLRLQHGRNRGLDPIRVLDGWDSLTTTADEVGTWVVHECSICNDLTDNIRGDELSVCAACREQVVCCHDTPIRGYNTTLTGGFAADHVDSSGEHLERCDNATDTGNCWIQGIACTIGEIRIGGVYIRRLPRT